MNDSMKIRAQLKNGLAEIKLLISHPMETGRRKNERGETESAHFIQLVTATLNGKTVMEAQWGTGISKNPYLTFRIKGAVVGDKIAVKWIDNKGETGAIEAAITAA